MEVRHAGIDSFEATADFFGGGQHEVAKALVPDMSDWVPLWTKRAGGSLNTLLKQLQYTGPLELFT